MFHLMENLVFTIKTRGEIALNSTWKQCRNLKLFSSNMKML
jgi:hypothetical protein